MIDFHCPHCNGQIRVDYRLAAGDPPQGGLSPLNHPVELRKFRATLPDGTRVTTESAAPLTGALAVKTRDRWILWDWTVDDHARAVSDTRHSLADHTAVVEICPVEPA